MPGPGGRGTGSTALLEPGMRMQKAELKRALETGEPCAWKPARTVRRGVVGNVPRGNALATNPTPPSARSASAMDWTSFDVSSRPLSSGVKRPTWCGVRSCTSTQHKSMPMRIWIRLRLVLRLRREKPSRSTSLHFLRRNQHSLKSPRRASVTTASRTTASGRRFMFANHTPHCHPRGTV